MKIAQRLLTFMALLVLTACDAGPSAVLTEGAGQSPSEQVAPREAPKPVSAVDALQPEIEAGAPREVAAPSESIKLKPGPVETATKTRYGEWPLWSSNRKYTAYENATYHFEKHGPEFGAGSYEVWLAMVHGFIHAPPKGVETISRNNGDTLFYDRQRNIFAVMTKRGAPRTMFRPDNGAAYWQKQKQIESERRTIRRDNVEE